MKININENLINRNARIGRYAGLLGLIILAGGAYISFTKPDMIGLAWAALFLGFATAQIGIFYGNRFGRQPRPYDLISRELKGLEGTYALYHFVTPASHLLVGPAGVWAIFPFYQRGTISYDKGRWRQKGGGLTLAYLKIFAQEGLGNPDVQVQTELERLNKYLVNKLGEEEVPPVQPVLVFTNEQATITDVEDAPYPAIPLKKLKDLVRKAAKSDAFSVSKAKAIQDAIEMT
jgi:hypothetical protein